MDTPRGGCERALAAVVHPGEIVRFRWAVDADGHAGACLGKEVQVPPGKERSIGLDTDGMTFGGKLRPQAAEQFGKLGEAEQQRFTPVEDDREPRLLAFRLLDEAVADGGQHVSTHAFRLKTPSGIRPPVHVAVRAVEVAPARGLDEDRVYAARGVHVAHISRVGYRPRLCRLCTRS